MAPTLNPLEAALARDLFAAGCQELADLEIAAAVHTARTRSGGDTFPATAEVRRAALALAAVWSDWLALVDFPRIVRSPEWAGFLGERGRLLDRLGGAVAALVDAAVGYAGTGDGRALDAAALDYGRQVLGITRGWKRGDPPAAGKGRRATAGFVRAA